MNIYEKLLAVKESVVYLKKENKGEQYPYVSSPQVIGSIRDEMNKQKLLLIPNIESTNVLTKEEEKGGGKKTITYFTEVKMSMTWLDVEKPEDKIVCQWYTQGVDIAGEKGIGKALTYGEKYFLLKFFNIPTDKDDPDAFQAKYSEPEEIDPEVEFEKLKTAISKAADMTALKKVGGKIAGISSQLPEDMKEKLREVYELRKGALC